MTEKENLHYVNSGEKQHPSSLFTPEEKAALAYINDKIAACQSLEEVIDFLFEHTQDLFPCDRIGVAFIEEDGRRLRLHYVVSNYEPLYLTEGYAADLSDSSLSAIFQSGSPRILNDLKLYAKSHPESESTTLLLKEGVLSSMTCPLTVDGRPVCLIFRSSRKARAYTDHHIDLHLEIAERLGQAVEKTYRIERLSEAINSYMEMLGFVTHELKSPLASIITLASTFRDGYFGPVSEEHKKIIDRIVKRASYLHDLSAEYLNLSRFESGRLKMNLQKADFIDDIIEPALEIILPQMEDRKIVLEKNIPSSGISLTCDPELMKTVMVNLLGNAVKYGNDGGTVRLTVNPDANILKVSVWNEGPGFSKEEKKILFRKFSRIDSPDLMKRKGSGIGLYIAWNIIQAHGGRIRAEAEKGAWAEFSFEIPLEPKTP